jgi:nickel transport protein
MLTRLIHLTALLLMGLWFLPATAVHAHHLWITQSREGLAIARGTLPDEQEPYRPAAVAEVAAWDHAGQPLALTRQDLADRVRFQTAGPAALATVRCDWGLRVNTTEGKKLIGRREAESRGLTVIDGFFSTQFSKTIFADSPLTTVPIGLLLEIVPLDNPATIPAGQPVKVRVLFEQRPLAGATVIFGKRRQRTDADGVAIIEVESTAKALIWARHQVPVPDDPEKNYILYTTFLVLTGR